MGKPGKPHRGNWTANKYIVIKAMKKMGIEKKKNDNPVMTLSTNE
jgi:hypothetical protein